METSREREASVMNHFGQAVNALQTGSGTSLAVENIPAMHDPTQPTFASECEIASKDRTHAKAAKTRKDGESVREWTPHGGSFPNRLETPQRDRPDAGSTGQRGTASERRGTKPQGRRLISFGPSARRDAISDPLPHRIRLNGNGPAMPDGRVVLERVVARPTLQRNARSPGGREHGNRAGEK